MDRASTVIAAIAIAAACACGKEAIPTERLGRAEGAVRTAQATGAERHPEAALHLRLAQENLERAKNLLSRGENERARHVLLRAEADADLARALHEQAEARAVADRAVADFNAAKSSPSPEGR